MLSADTLRHLYVDERLTMAEVARRFACSASTVRRRLRAWRIPTRTQGPKTSHHGVHGAAGGLAWSAEVAWIVGLMASDGNLARTGHALSLTSNDVELLESVRSILRIGNRLGHVRGGLGHACHRLQWRDRELYGWLSDIGLTPRKSLTLGPLTVPDEYFADFFRGCIDGDGTILVYTDRHHATRNATYVYERLYLSIVSASLPFVIWLQETIARLTGARGTVYNKAGRNRRPIWTLRYAKRESLRLLPWMYPSPGAPCLRRKRAKAEQFMPRPE